MKHYRTRQEDEYHCPKCRKTWAVNDPEPPPCDNDRPITDKQWQDLKDSITQL